MVKTCGLIEYNWTSKDWTDCFTRSKRVI